MSNAATIEAFALEIIDNFKGLPDETGGHHAPGYLSAADINDGVSDLALALGGTVHGTYNGPNTSFQAGQAVVVAAGQILSAEQAGNPVALAQAEFAFQTDVNLVGQGHNYSIDLHLI